MTTASTRPIAGADPDWSAPPWRALLAEAAQPSGPSAPTRLLDAMSGAAQETAPTADAAAQERHYDAVAAAYLRNLDEPHVQAYQAHLDAALDRAIAESLDHDGDGSLGTLVELCCGHADGIARYHGRATMSVGVDVSRRMLEAALERLGTVRCAFIHGDATRLPLRSGVADTVLLLGGVHHVNDRAALFAEIARILRPGGRLVFREPLDDLFLWRMLRRIVYRLSPNLDPDTERPLRRHETFAQLAQAGLRVQRWEPAGLFGFCLFMNTDVLVANRLFRWVPGIRAIAHAVARLDAALLRLAPLRNAGLQVIAVARRPEGGA